MISLPDNSALLAALTRFRDGEADDSAALRALLETLLQSTLLVGDDGEPSYVETEQDQIYLALFTDPIEIHSFDPEAEPRVMKAVEAIRQVARGEWSGLILNPAGQSLELSAEDIRDFFDVDEDRG